jgi:chromosome segregation ATPase
MAAREVAALCEKLCEQEENYARLEKALETLQGHTDHARILEVVQPKVEANMRQNAETARIVTVMQPEVEANTRQNTEHSRNIAELKATMKNCVAEVTQAVTQMVAQQIQLGFWEQRVLAEQQAEQHLGNLPRVNEDIGQTQEDIRQANKRYSTI